MFMSITKQVLRNKKETKERQAHQNNDIVNLNKGKNNAKGVKRKCC